MQPFLPILAKILWPLVILQAIATVSILAGALYAYFFGDENSMKQCDGTGSLSHSWPHLYPNAKGYQTDAELPAQQLLLRENELAA